MSLDSRKKRALAEQVRRWRNDPVAFVRRIFGAEPEQSQADIMMAFAQPGAKVTVKAGHGVGKTTVGAWLGIWHTSLFEDSKTGATAPSATQLKDVLMAEIGKWVHRAHPWIRNQLIFSSFRLEVRGRESSQFLTARTAKPEAPDALQGLHAKHMAFIIEEAFGVADPIFEVAKGALSTHGARALLIGNPTSTSGYAFDSHHKNADLWKRFTLSCIDSKLASPQYVKEMREEYGEDSDVYKVRVLGQFPSAAINQLIPRSLAEACAARKLARMQYEFAPKIIGVDPAWEGDDRSTIVLRQGLQASLLGVYSKIGNVQLGGLVNQFARQHNAAAIFVDIGWGAGVIDYLRALGQAPIPVNFGGASLNIEHANKRTQMWFDMLKWMSEGGATWKDEKLIDDLVGPLYYFMPNGKKLLERKKDMKKRGLRSPDIADALALTFAEPVHVPIVSPSGAPIRSAVARAQMEYDVLA